jgi:hypothetical protein
VRSAVSLAIVIVVTAAAAPAAPAGENGGVLRLSPGGVQLWNPGYWETVTVGRFSGDNSAGLKPVVICGARNGTFSGCVVATSSGPIRGLRAQASDLVAEGGAKIPASALLVRYARLALPGDSWNGVGRFDALLEKPPAEAPPPQFSEYGTYLVKKWTRQGGKPVATQPVWVTVKVPKDAKPGRYTGTLAVQAQGLSPVRVPLTVEVAGWTVPDPEDFTVRNLARVSWEEEARFYNVPLWSDKHLELAGRTMELMNAIGSQQLDIELAEHCKHRDNSESMVLWVGRPGGPWKYDFSAVEKVFDLCAEKYGRPCPLRVNLWWYEFKANNAQSFKSKGNRAGKVTTLDPSTGKKGQLNEPPLGGPENVAFWRPVMTELRKRIEKRGWWKFAAVGDARYAGSCDAPCVDTIHAIWPDAVWAATQHGTTRTFVGTDKARVKMPVAYGETVWAKGKLEPYLQWVAGGAPAVKVVALKPATTGVNCTYLRNKHHDKDPIWVHRVMAEEIVMRAHHGVGPLGGNLWPINRDNRGRYTNVAENCHLGPGCSTKGLVAPGPEGAVASERYEAFREGVQVAEAMLVLVRGLAGGRLDGALAKRAREILAERAKKWREAGGGSGKGGGPNKWDFAKLADGAADRDARLFRTAAEVAAKLGNR